MAKNTASNDFDVWVDVPGYVGFYEVSDTGHVRSVRKGRVLTPKKRGRYLAVELYKYGKRKLYSIHRIVLESFIGASYGRQTRHLDGDCHNNHIDNLRWGTPKQNANDRSRHGTLLSRDNGIPTAKLSRADVEAIKQDRRVSRLVAVDYGVCSSLIRNIRCGIAK